MYDFLNDTYKFLICAQQVHYVFVFPSFCHQLLNLLLSATVKQHAMYF